MYRQLILHQYFIHSENSKYFIYSETYLSKVPLWVWYLGPHRILHTCYYAFQVVYHNVSLTKSHTRLGFWVCNYCLFLLILIFFRSLLQNTKIKQVYPASFGLLVGPQLAATVQALLFNWPGQSLEINGRMGLRLISLDQDPPLASLFMYCLEANII